MEHKFKNKILIFLEEKAIICDLSFRNSPICFWNCGRYTPFVKLVL